MPSQETPTRGAKDHLKTIEAVMIALMRKEESPALLSSSQGPNMETMNNYGNRIIH